MKHFITILLIIVIVVLLIPSAGMAQQIEGEIEYQLHDLEERVENLESEINRTVSPGIMVFLFGVFCALWAQNTKRNAWLWFFLGVFFNVITVIVLLWKNSRDRKQSPISKDAV